MPEARRNVEGLMHRGLPHYGNPARLGALGAIEINAEDLAGCRPAALQRCEGDAHCAVPDLCLRIDAGCNLKPEFQTQPSS